MLWIKQKRKLFKSGSPTRLRSASSLSISKSLNHKKALVSEWHVWIFEVPGDVPDEVLTDQIRQVGGPPHVDEAMQ